MSERVLSVENKFANPSREESCWLETCIPRCFDGVKLPNQWALQCYCLVAAVNTLNCSCIIAKLRDLLIV